jgi:hypothetical protein
VSESWVVSCAPHLSSFHVVEIGAQMSSFKERSMQLEGVEVPTDTTEIEDTRLQSIPRSYTIHSSLLTVHCIFVYTHVK